MQSILIRHLAGARANQLDEFPGDGETELTIGRDVSSHIRFDPDRDDLVSRLEAELNGQQTTSVLWTVRWELGPGESGGELSHQ